MFIHGLLHDVLTPLIGFAVFEDTRWGGVAGSLMIVFPAYWLGQYFLSVYLFGRNVLFLLGTQLAVVLGLIRDVHIRFALMPFALLLLAAVLRKPTWPRTGALALVLAAQAVTRLRRRSSFPPASPYSASTSSRRTTGVSRSAELQADAADDGRGSALLLAACSALFFARPWATPSTTFFLFFYRTFASEHTPDRRRITARLAPTDRGSRFAAISPVGARDHSPSVFFATDTGACDRRPADRRLGDGQAVADHRRRSTTRSSSARADAAT